MRIHEFDCSRCGKHKTHESDTTTGYATDDKGNKTCFDCCAEVDKEYMREHGKIALYLSKDDSKQWRVTNWPSTLVMPAINNHVQIGYHNMARRRYDVWFVGPDNFVWHGVQYGEMTQIVHCKRTKEVWNKSPKSAAIMNGLKEQS